MAWAGEPVLDLEPAQLIDDAVIVLDPAGIVRSWSPGAERIEGWTAEEIIGRSFETSSDPSPRGVRRG